MNRYILTWPDDRSSTYRNQVNEDPRPTEIIADSWCYQSLNNGTAPVGLSFWRDGDENDAVITLFEFPVMIETRPNVSV